MKIGLQFAMPAEFHALPGAKELEAFETVSGVPFYEAAPGIIACAGGVSKVNAAMAAEILCLKYGVDMIVNAGVAGCLTELPTGSLVVAEDFVQHDVDTSAIGDSVGLVSTVNRVSFPTWKPERCVELLAALGRKAALGLIDKLATALEKNPTSGGSATLSRLEKGIRLEQVSFSYDGEKDVLHELSAEFKVGKAYAIVGGSGSGKSTLLHLLMAGSREYAGSILLDGTELRSIAPESLYETISAIQQNVFVFNASIKDNVSMFRSFPRQELDEAMRRAHLTGLIAERGEDYLCGEGGSGLSGGEKQRISIARSLLKKSSVLLADEVTASLDAQTAYQVTSDILDLHGMTRIIVTHTLEESLLHRYDGILVLKDGRIAEAGSFDELMEKKGYFFALFTVAQ